MLHILIFLDEGLNGEIDVSSKSMCYDRVQCKHRVLG
ncbi:hypothetical protein A2U01_0106750, partial [Trifolium medium]|nr:hypothetical protein [Trifolium medium]